MSRPVLSAPPRHLRSALGRRPPFYDLEDATEIDEMCIEDLEFGDPVHLKPYEDGIAPDGRRGWNDEHERLLRWFYETGSPSLVDPRFPSQHSLYLSSEAIAVRDRGVPAISDAADSLCYLLHKSTFTKTYVKPWLALNRKKQKQLILAVLAALDHQDPSNSFPRYRKLLPEVILLDLVADGGQGLVKLFDLLRQHLGSEHLDLGNHPVPNDSFFRKFGIASNDQTVPSTAADRAFQEEYLMRRHSLLFSFVDTTLRHIIGDKKPKKVQPVASTASDSTTNEGFRLPKSSGSGGGESYLVDERCSFCQETAHEAKVDKLLYCEYCKKVERAQAYCSRTCQREHWSLHRPSCGISLREIHPTPIPSALPASTLLNNAGSSNSSKTPTSRQASLRGFIGRSLTSNPQEFWFYTCSRGVGRIGFDGWGDESRKQRVCKAMRKLVLKAVGGDQASIDLLSTVMEVILVEVPVNTGSTKKDLKFNLDGFGGQGEEGLAQLRETFGLEDDTKWEEAKQRGKLEMEKPGNEAVKEFYAGSVSRAMMRDMMQSFPEVVIGIVLLFVLKKMLSLL